MQNQSTPKRKTRARTKKTVVCKEAGFSIREHASGFIVQIRRKGFSETKTFATIEAAKLHCQSLNAKRTNEGLSAFTLTPAQRDDASRALSALKGRASLLAAVQAWTRLNPDHGAVTVAELFDRHVVDLEGRNRRPDTLRERNQRLNRFAADYGKRAATSIMPADVEQWLTLRVPPKSFNPFRLSLSAAFSFAVKKGIVPANPVSAVASKTVERNEPHFWPVETVTAVMKAAAALDGKKALIITQVAARRAEKGKPAITPTPPLLPCLALSAFAGLRPAESERLDWSNVNLDEALIRIPAAVSKVRRARLVSMPDNLVRWLLPYRQTTGPVSPSAVTIKRGRKAILEDAELPAHWPQDVLRHSFATHWMAAHSHEGQLAEMLGNSPAIIQRHYKGLVTAKEGAKYFKIMPPAENNVIQLAASA